MKYAGFTLIELIVVISVTAVLSIIGIAAFVTYSRTQALTTSVLDIVTMLQVAKSRAQSQVKPDAAPCLDGYRVAILSSNKTYQMFAVCLPNDYPVAGYTKKLPSNICFDASATTTTSILFRVLTGGVGGGGDIQINGYGSGFKITVNSAGNIVFIKTVGRVCS